MYIDEYKHRKKNLYYNIFYVPLGAIKFGDTLSLEQCINLFNDLKNTKSPTRCAHGRPSIIPIIELSELRRTCYKNIKVLLVLYIYLNI